MPGVTGFDQQLIRSSDVDLNAASLSSACSARVLPTSVVACRLYKGQCQDC